MRLLKFLVVAALVLCIGLPAAFLLFVFTMAALGVVLGIGGAIIGLMFAVLKMALMVLLPLALVYWIAKRLMAPEHTR